MAQSEAERLRAMCDALQNDASAQKAFNNLLSQFAPLHGLPKALWMRLVFDEFGRSDKNHAAIWVRVLHSLHARSGRPIPDWINQMILEESNTICDQILSHPTHKQPRRSAYFEKAVRDMKLVHATRRERTERGSLNKAFPAVAKRLTKKAGSSGGGTPYSRETTKRAWRRFCSEAAYRRLYGPG